MFARYCLPFGVMMNVFLPSYSILLINPAPVRLSTNFESLECDKLAFVRSDVTLIPLMPLSSVTVSKSLTICMLVLYATIVTIIGFGDIRVLLFILSGSLKELNLELIKGNLSLFYL